MSAAELKQRGQDTSTILITFIGLAKSGEAGEARQATHTFLLNLAHAIHKLME